MRVNDIPLRLIIEHTRKISSIMCGVLALGYVSSNLRLLFLLLVKAYVPFVNVTSFSAKNSCIVGKLPSPQFIHSKF